MLNIKYKIPLSLVKREIFKKKKLRTLFYATNYIIYYKIKNLILN